MSELILSVSLPDLPRNTRAGQSVARVRRLGYVPPCVQDAFSWLPPAIPALPRVVERVIRKAQMAGFEAASATDEQILMLDGIKKAHIARFREWLKNGGPDSIVRDTGPQPPSGQRCHRCVFQAPEWSQMHARCSHSWCHDRDGGCQAFVDRAEFLERQPSYARFCRKPGMPGWPYDIWPDVFPGWKRWDELPDATCHLPSHYYARINRTDWYASPGMQELYRAVECERLRRFAGWANGEGAQEASVEAVQQFLPGF